MSEIDSQKFHAITDKKTIKKLILAKAIYNGDLYCARQLYSSFSWLYRTLDKGNISGILTEFEYMLPDESMRSNNDFKEIIRWISDDLVEKKALSSEVIEKIITRAIQLGKYSFADTAAELLKCRDKYVSIYCENAQEYLTQEDVESAANMYLIAASISYGDYLLHPVSYQYKGHLFQYVGPEIHSRCAEYPQGCITNQEIDQIIEVGIEYLLLKQNIAQKLLSECNHQTKRSLLRILASKRDYNIGAFIKNYKAGVEKITTAKTLSDYLDIQRTLLGRTTTTDEYWQYLKELSLEHPISALVVCIKSYQNKRIVVPVIRDSVSLMEQLGLLEELIPTSVIEDKQGEKGYIRYEPEKDK